MSVCLARFIAGEKKAWKKSLEERKERRRQIGKAIVAGVTERKGNLDSTTVARARYDDTRSMALDVRLRMASASAMLGIQKQQVELQFREWGLEAFGIKQDDKTADFKLDKALTDFKKKRDTGLNLNKFERKNVRLHLDVARLLVQVDAEGVLLSTAKSKLEKLRTDLGQEKSLLEELKSAFKSLF